jgi:hypothetical protein
MRPTTSELLAAIVVSLESQVAPKVQDKWAASALRSATQLLNHLAVRADRQGEVLTEDNEDVRQVLEAILSRLTAQPELAALRATVEKTLSGAAPAPHDHAGLDERNEIYQAAVEQLLRRLPVGSIAGSSVHDELRSYLRRRLRREHSLYFPVFTGPPF